MDKIQTLGILSFTCNSKTENYVLLLILQIAIIQNSKELTCVSNCQRENCFRVTWLRTDFTWSNGCVFKLTQIFWCVLNFKGFGTTFTQHFVNNTSLESWDFLQIGRKLFLH